jgi:23S rRNA (uracil1939-C5)-methyltransferase
MAHGGDGIGRIDGRVCFVAGAIPGDTVRVHITRDKKSALWGEVAEVVEASPDRVEHELPEYDADGAATWLHFAYPAQAEWKCRIVQESLERIGGVAADVEWLDDPDLRLGYRTRATFHGDGVKLGYYRRGTHDILDLKRDPLSHEKLNAAFEKLRETNLKGSATLTVDPEGDKVLVWSKFPKRKLKTLFPNANTPAEEGNRAMFFFDGVPIVNGCFSQSSLLLNRLLLSVVHNFVDNAPSVLDLYCGNGNLTIGLGDRAEITGMDHNRYAVKSARRTKRGEYRPGGESEMLNLLAEDQWDTIVLDPPRAGAKALAPALAASTARKLIYVSCDPATLGRDLKTIVAGGWMLEKTVAIDLFPNTAHVETVCLLVKG